MRLRIWPSRNLCYKRLWIFILLMSLFSTGTFWGGPMPPCDAPRTESTSGATTKYSSGLACAAATKTARRRQSDTDESTPRDDKRLQGRVPEQMNLNKIILKVGKRGLGGGVPGAIAGAVQVLTLMWLRTIINYQSRYGTTFSKAVSMLYKDGGIRRFYRGLSFAMFQAPFARFVSTAANDGVQTLLASFETTRGWGAGRTTVIAAFVVGLARMVLMPIDTCKTVLQVDSVEGFRSLMRRVRAGKIGVLYQGAIANAISSVVGHYPWFLTYNYLSQNSWLQNVIQSTLLRNAGIGLAASVISDTIVNAIRVVKTTKQSIGSKHDLSYGDTIRMILAADGWKGLFGRGLRTRIMANALQSIVFTIIWRGLAERWGANNQTENVDESSSSKRSDRMNSERKKK